MQSENFKNQKIIFVSYKKYDELFLKEKVFYKVIKMSFGDVIVVFSKIGIFEVLPVHFIEKIDFQKKEDVFPNVIYVKSTCFSQKVFKYILKTRKGQLYSYSDVAININHPKAVRAVGLALKKNPIFCFIPCHRIIYKNKKIGGYKWGEELKLRLLQYEKSSL
jgi:O-6-methylguanine DNA methyltransferase